MPELIRPEEIFVNRPANFRIRLVPPDEEGIYRFAFNRVKDDDGFVSEYVDREMRLGRWDAELEVTFKQAAVRELFYALLPDESATPAGELAPVGASTTSEDPVPATEGGEKPRSRSRAKAQAQAQAQAQAESESQAESEAEAVTEPAGSGGGPRWKSLGKIYVRKAPPTPAADQTVALVAAPTPASADEILWFFIRRVTDRLRFDEFNEIVQPQLTGPNGPEWFGTDAYRRLSQAATRFVEFAADPTRAVKDENAPDNVILRGELSEQTVAASLLRSYVSDEDGDLAQPFLTFDGVRPAASNGQSASAPGRALRHNVFPSRQTDFPLPNVPFVELIWNYWMEEGMLVQTLNHILARFQNRRLMGGRDALARFDLNPLLPLRNLLWGFAELEQDRLTVRRRAAEYQYQYGLTLVGRAVPPASSVVDTRAQFLHAFHGLLNAAHTFFKERDDKTVDADAFPLLSSLREVHLVLSYGAHNQFADLPLTARAQFLTMQWVVSQPEMREFLGGPTMVPYEEPWMDRVDAMKTLQSWSPVSVTHFFDLAVTGEQVVLSLRHGRWNESTRTRDDAANWALTWRNEIQRYIHAYRTVTGVDLTNGVDATMPSTLLARRIGRGLHHV